MTRAEIIIVCINCTYHCRTVLSRKVVPSIFAAAIFACVLLIIHFFELKSKKMEQFLNGSSIIVVENGEIVKREFDEGENVGTTTIYAIKRKGIHDLKSLQQVTAEPNGRIGYQLIEKAQPITLEVLEKVIDQYNIKR